MTVRDLALTKALAASAAEATARAEAAEDECRRLRADIAQLVRERDNARRAAVRAHYGVVEKRQRRPWILP